MIRILFLALILISYTPAHCQDLLAKQAPVASKSPILTLFIAPKGVVSIQKYQGSDYIPKTAPVDKGMRQVDSIVLNKKADQDEASFPSPDHSSNNAHFHKVKNGETLQDIARKCNTTVEQLCKLNHISKNAKLKPGQILKYN
jgi:LysM repeat protein